MNPKCTNEKRKAGPSSILAGISVGLVIVFELTYIVMASSFGNTLLSHFSPKVSEEDQTMLQASLDRDKSRKKHQAPKPAPTNAVTAVDAALMKQAAEQTVKKAPTIMTDKEGIPSAITGADSVQWSVVNTNELKALAHDIAATNAMIEAAAAAALTNALNAATNAVDETSSTNAVPAESDSPETGEPVDEEVIPVG
jgi:hypothetical protein